MTHADRLLITPATFRRLTGLTPAAFRRLVGEVAEADAADRARRAGRPGRRRKARAGRKSALPIADQLLMLLVYYRTYVPHAFLGFFFGIDDSNVSRGIRRLKPLLAGIFRIPERKPDLTPEDVRELFFDGTERPTARPVRGQRAFDSGKKRRHTLKLQVVAVRVRKRSGLGPRERRQVRIAAVSPTFPGSAHDKNVYDRTRVVIPRGVPGCGDTAYLGTGMRTPRRKPKGER